MGNRNAPIGRAGKCRGDSWDYLYLDSCGKQCLYLFSAATKQERVSTFETYNQLIQLAQSHQFLVDGILRKCGIPGSLPHIDQCSVARNELLQSRIDQKVSDHHIGRPEQLEAPHGY
jgi:hypothetical protein